MLATPNQEHEQQALDDTGAAILEFESGAIGTIASSYVSPKTYSIRLLGTDAVLDYRTDISVSPAADELEELGGCARGEATPETGADEGIAALRVIIEATQRPQ